MASRKPIPVASKSYAFIGKWSDNGALGWHVPQFLGGRADRRDVAKPNQSSVLAGFADADFYLCLVTITPIRDSRGRFITRKAKTLRIVKEA